MTGSSYLPAHSILLSTCTASPSHSSLPDITLQLPSLPTLVWKAQVSVCSVSDDGVSGHRHTQVPALSTRRELIRVASLSLPWLLPSRHAFVGAKASESSTSEYQLIETEVRKVLSTSRAAGLLRLVFHDAGTYEMDDNSGGMNGSILYELDRPENAGLRKSIKILNKAKTEIDAVRPVSWADIIAVAGAEAISICGGPSITVRLGRLDSLEPDPEGKMPQESLDASGLKNCFRRKGFSTRELVALSGAHTLGNKGFGNPNSFDNSYYKILLEKPWTSSAGMSSMIGLPSDRALVQDEECIRWITRYAENQSLFFEDFGNAYVKLVNSGVRWRSA